MTKRWKEVSWIQPSAALDFALLSPGGILTELLALASGTGALTE